MELFLGLMLVTECSVLFCFETATLQNVLIWKFIKNELHVRFYHKVGQALLQSGAALLYQKVGQVSLKSGKALWYHKMRQTLSGGSFLGFELSRFLIIISLTSNFRNLFFPFLSLQFFRSPRIAIFIWADFYHAKWKRL